MALPWVSPFSWRGSLGSCVCRGVRVCHWVRACVIGCRRVSLGAAVSLGSCVSWDTGVSRGTGGVTKASQMLVSRPLPRVARLTFTRVSSTRYITPVSSTPPPP